MHHLFLENSPLFKTSPTGQNDSLKESVLLSTDILDNVGTGVYLLDMVLLLFQEVKLLQVD